MNIPESFKKVIADTFYDKKLELWTEGTIRDVEGAVIANGKKDKVTDFIGNFQFQTREKIQQEYGQEIDAEAIITCDFIDAEIGNIVVYNNKDYIIRSSIKCDSHMTILVKGI